jgi:heptosyltransferase-2
MHFVLIRFSSLGDIILQSPIFSWLQSQFPNCKITFITSEEFSSLVKGHPYIDEVRTIKRLKGSEDIKQLMNLSKVIQDELKADIIIDLHNTLRAKLIRFFSFKTPSIVVFKRGLLRFLLIRFKINFLSKLESHHERVINDIRFILNKELNASELSQFNKSKTGIENIGLSTVPKSFTKTKVIVDGDYIAISPIASFETKRWPMESFKIFLETFLRNEKYSHLKVVLVAGPNDTYCDEMISQFVGNSLRFVNLQGKTTLEETSMVLARAKVCVTNDTGTGHITEAFGNPVIAIFGPTSESFGFKPHLALSKSVSIKEWCRPCSGTGSKKCFRKEQYCMTGISPEFVLTELEKTLERMES